MKDRNTPVSVLIADDSSVVRERMAALLKEVPGVSVVGEAVTVSATLDGLRRLRPSVLVLDLSMPGGSGLDVLREIGSDQPRPTVIVLTNYSFPEYETEACRLGANAFLNKSTQFMQVADLVRGLTDQELAGAGVEQASAPLAEPSAKPFAHPATEKASAPYLTSISSGSNGPKARPASPGQAPGPDRGTSTG